MRYTTFPTKWAIKVTLHPKSFYHETEITVAVKTFQLTH